MKACSQQQVMISQSKSGKNLKMVGKLFLGIKQMQVLIVFNLPHRNMDFVWQRELLMEKSLS